MFGPNKYPALEIIEWWLSCCSRLEPLLDLNLMPYLSPSASTMTASNPSAGELASEANRPSHRRTRSATPTFSTETGSNAAFTPLVGLPRRQRQFEKRTLFQIAPDDDEEPDSFQSVTPKSTPAAVEPPELRISVPIPGTPPTVSHIPFPTTVSNFL